MATFFKSMKSTTYHKLGDNNDPPTQSKTTFNWQVGVPWILTAILTIFSGYLLWHQHGPYASYGPHKTDLPDVRPFISYEERVFTGKFAYNKETGMVYREVDPSQPQYAGEPSPEIDAAWAELLRGNGLILAR
jgi:hypothetical protein